MRRQTRSAVTTILLSLALCLASLPPAGRTVQAQSGVTAETQAPNLFLPQLGTLPEPPQFEIINPHDGLTVSGMMLFAVQPAHPNAVFRVTFRAGEIELGVDSTPADGFHVFLDADVLPAGPVQLSATASGPGGSPVTKSIDVVVNANPPSSATVDEDGATLATESGSTISIPPGALVNSATITVQDKSQSQVTQEQKIDWDTLGVTFLGAINIQTTENISKPLGISSVGFGNRVQPGQAIVAYQILPDADGDGAGELVVINGADVAPDGTIVSAAVPELLLNSLSVVSLAQQVRTAGIEQTLTGPPGTPIQATGSGFNPVSARGNVAIFRSLVNGETFEVPAAVSVNANNPNDQILTTLIPPLAPGAATLTLRNESAESEAGPFAVTVTASAVANSAAGEIIDDFWELMIDTINSLPTSVPGAAMYRDQVVDEFTEIRAKFKEVDEDPRAEVKAYLVDMATIIQNSGILEFAASAQLDTPQKLNPREKAFLDIATAVLGVITAGGAFLIATGGGAAAFPILAPVMAGIGLAVAMLKLYQALEDGLNPCGPSVGTMIKQALRDAITGMGAAPPPGGDGCGNTAKGTVEGVKSAGVSQSEVGRYSIKVFSLSEPPVRLTPFTGATDGGDYFYIPLIPEGEPFKAVALDNVTGASASFEGVGPATGKSVVMVLDFTDATGNRFPISIGETITNGVPGPGAGNIEEPGGVDIYTFQGEANQRIYLDLFGVAAGLSSVDWQLIAPDGDEIFGQPLNCCGGLDSGHITLPQSGTYILRVGDDPSPATGLYGFSLLNIPVLPPVEIAVGDTITDGMPVAGTGNLETPGALDIYTFEATAGQQIFFDAFGVAESLSQAHWSLLAPNGDLIFDKIFNCCGGINAGVYTLTQSAIYTLTVQEVNRGNTGQYGFKLWDVPAPQEFDIAVGDTVSNGNPGAGAGNIESPGAKDIYTFVPTMGAELIIDFEGAATALTQIDWKLIAPNGALIDNAIINCCGGADSPAFTVTQNGPHTLLIGDTLDEGTGAYTFTIRPK